VASLADKGRNKFDENWAETRQDWRETPESGVFWLKFRESSPIVAGYDADLGKSWA